MSESTNDTYLTHVSGLKKNYQELLFETSRRAVHYLQGLDTRPVFPTPDAIEGLTAFNEELPDEPCDPLQTIALLDEFGSPATVASPGGRYFGFVVGGSHPATLASNWLAGAWDQNAVLQASSPVSAKLEEVALSWLLEVLGLPLNSGGGFVTGATMANFSGLAAARHTVLKQVGWNVEDQGLFGAPPITVVVGQEVHVSLLKALALLGLGRGRVVKVPVDNQGRMIPQDLPSISGPTIVCIQAGNVNTGAFDPAEEICRIAHDSGAWVHVDGAFGLWAASSPTLAQLSNGVDLADSWATDAHKWLNVPYDCGIILCRDAEALRAALTHSHAAYLVEGGQREPTEYTPEMSRRARGVEVWAALRSLGRAGLKEMVEQSCRHAARFAQGLSAAGFQVLNQVELNQVLVSFGTPEKTQRVIQSVQRDGTCWCGGTVWQGHTAMRISVSSWATTAEDVEVCIEAIVRAANQAG